MNTCQFPSTHATINSNFNNSNYNNTVFSNNQSSLKYRDFRHLNLRTIECSELNIGNKNYILQSLAETVLDSGAKSSNKIDAFAIVHDVNYNIITLEELINRLVTIFGHACLKSVVILLTNADNVSFEEFLMKFNDNVKLGRLLLQAGRVLPDSHLIVHFDQSLFDASRVNKLLEVCSYQEPYSHNIFEVKLIKIQNETETRQSKPALKKTREATDLLIKPNNNKYIRIDSYSENNKPIQQQLSLDSSTCQMISRLNSQSSKTSGSTSRSGCSKEKEDYDLKSMIQENMKMQYDMVQNMITAFRNRGMCHQGMMKKARSGTL